MATNYASEFPLMIVGTDVITNPSFEDWSSGSPVGWTKTSTVTPEYDLVQPHGFVSALLAENATLVQNLAISNFGLSALPIWATYFVVAALTRGGNGSLAIGATSAAMANESSKWKLSYVESTSVGNITITGGAGGTYVDSVMAGFAIDIDVFMTAHDPVTKAKREMRETPFNMMAQLESDAVDLKATFNHFGQTLKDKFIGAIFYMQKGHYYAFILDRKNSGDIRDEVFPYLSYDSQESPGFVAGAPGVYTMKLNGRGNLP